MALYLIVFFGLAGLFLIYMGNALRKDAVIVGGIFSMLLGVAVIGAAAWLGLAIDGGTDRGAEIAALRNDLGATETKLTNAKSELAVARQQVRRMTARNQDLIDVHDTRLLDTLKLARAVNPAASNVRLPERSPGEAASQARNDKLAARVKAEIARLGEQLGRKTKIEQAQPASFGEVAKLRDRMAYGFETDHYGVQVYPDNELVGGKQGKYYVVDIKNAENGERFQFGGGKYTLSRSSKAFRNGLSVFMRDVVGKVEGNVDYVLFVRGSADSVPYRGRFEDGYEFRSVRFMRALGGGKYVSEFSEQTIGDRIRNRDLPFLRAEFLKSVVSEVYPVRAPIVLEGSVTDARNKQDRNAELILYVNW
ncbi:MAG: hypothetical protein AAFQ45_11075 [Pseudomonadota bacterium]